MICKSGILSQAIAMNYCFILTMWYVNAVKKNEDKLDKECFILTMWYVNHTKKLLLEYANKVLY